MVGLYRERNNLVLFSDFRPEYRHCLRRMAVLRAIHQVRKWIGERGLPVTALSQPDEPESPVILQRLGFEYLRTIDLGDMYVWPG